MENLYFSLNTLKVVMNRINFVQPFLSFLL